MGDLVQVLKGTSLTVTETFSVDGSPTDVDSGLPTLALVKPDGTAHTPTPTVSGSWTGRTTGQYRFVLPQQPDPTWRDYTLTGTIGGQQQTLAGRVEWIGALLFTLGELRALKVAGSTPFSSTTTWPNEQLQEARTATLDEFEQILGFSPVPRFYREIHSLGRGTVILRQLMPLNLRGQNSPLLSVSVAGVAQTTSNYFVDQGGVLLPVTAYSTGAWGGWGTGDLAVEYQAGWDRPKGDGTNVAMLRAAMRLDPGISSTATTVTTPDGISYNFDPAGQVTRGGTVRHFGVPAIDSWLARWSQAGLAVA